MAETAKLRQQSNLFRCWGRFDAAAPCFAVGRAQSPDRSFWRLMCSHRSITLHL